MSFSKDNARKSSRILIVDHGGGTINTCVVEVDRHGEVKTSARPKSPQARMGGGSFIDQFMLRKKIREANFNHDLRRKLLESERLVFPRVAEVLSQVEKIKIMFSRGELKESRELTVNLGVPGTESWTFSISPSDVEEAFSYVWDRHGKIAIAATLGADDSKKIDYVILSGGTCHLGLHERYLNRDFGGYFKQSETSFVNISGEIKPVSFGLCFQGLLDRMEKGLQPKAVAAPAPQEAVTQELREEDLSDYVSRNLILTISGEADGGDKKFGEGVLVRSGSPKDALWNSERKVQLRLWKKPRRAFRFAIGPDDASEQPPEAGVVTIRHKMADVVEKTISVSFTVNEEGVCQPKFYLSPYQKPTYYEPDKETFKVLIPELAKAKSDPVQTPDRPETLGQAEAHLHTSAAADEDQILGFDFGTSMSALVGLDYAIGVETISKQRGFFTVDYIQAVASSEVNTESSEIRQEDLETVRRLQDCDTEVARSYRQVMSDLQSSRYSYKGTAAELRATIEALLERLAPDAEVQKYGIKADPQTKRVPYAARATFILKKKRAADDEEAKKCSDSVKIIEEGVGNVLRGTHKRASGLVHAGASDERVEVLRLQRYFRAIVHDLID